MQSLRKSDPPLPPPRFDELDSVPLSFSPFFDRTKFSLIRLREMRNLFEIELQRCKGGKYFFLTITKLLSGFVDKDSSSFEKEGETLRVFITRLDN